MKIVALDGYTLNPGDNSWSPVERLGELVVYDRTEPRQVVERSLGADIVLTNKAVISQNELAQLPNLKLIVVTATGFNVVDVEAAAKRGVPVCNAPEYSTQSVAQHVFAMILSYLHRPYQHDLAIRQGAWKASGDFCFWLEPIEELSGKSIGIIGYGKIGQAVGRLAEAFGMSVLAYSPRPKPDVFPGVEWCDLELLLNRSDIVSLHCPQTSRNSGMVDSGFLNNMKHSAILVNASRSGLVVEADLVIALRKGVIKGALLDVASTEPIADDNPLLQLENCVLTPHIAWSSLAARKRLMQITADNIQAFVEGEMPNQIN
ncbi:MAG: D-2-hydroxyacid dehydrogenase [Mariniblastus sp.]|nr:D-2-hydroxyacid dehydrogenase [Mariniblastus sp.]